jgi:hypothetical protein
VVQYLQIEMEFGGKLVFLTYMYHTSLEAREGKGTPTNPYSLELILNTRRKASAFLVDHQISQLNSALYVRHINSIRRM